MQISDEIKEQILSAVDLADLIGEVVDLRRKGSSYSGLCPFHNEKTPSFMVSPNKGIYKCFGCGKSGNAISFMKDYHGYSFVETMKELAKRAGVQLDESNSFKVKEELTKKDIAYLALESANKFYVRSLSQKEGKTALNYFKKRGFTTQTISDFQLGYAPDAWDLLLNELQKQNLSIEAMTDGGLIIKNENKGTYYDRFRNRAIFPIHNYLGKTIGFGARILTNEKDQPKYINSPQTIVYDKSKTLYGLYQSKNEIRNQGAAILVEGYTDTISLFQAGFRNVVASSGTSLTGEQLNMLNKLCKRLYFVYDADNAGVKAVERGLDMALARGFDVMIVQLPSGEDPDSLILNHGAALFQSYLNEAVGFLDFLIGEMQRQGKFATPHLKASSIRTILGIIVKIPDKLLHDDYMSKMATMLQLSENQIKKVYQEKAKLESGTEQNRTSEQSRDSRTAPRENDQALNPSESKQAKAETILREEKSLLAIAISDDEAFDIIFKKMKIKQELFISAEAKRLFETAEGFAVFNDNYLAHIIEDDSISEEDKNFFSQIGLKIDELSPNWSKFVKNQEKYNLVRNIKDLIYSLKLVKIDLELEEQKLLLSDKNADLTSALKAISELSTLKAKLSFLIANGYDESEKKDNE